MFCLTINSIANLSNIKSDIMDSFHKMDKLHHTKY